MAVTITCLKLVAFLQWSKCWEQTYAYFFDRPEVLNWLDSDFCTFATLNSSYNWAHFSFKNWAEHSYLVWLINDKTINFLPQSLKLQKKKFFFNPLQCQKQRRGATCRSKQGEISGEYKTNEKRQTKQLGFSAMWPCFHCHKTSYKHNHLWCRNCKSICNTWIPSNETQKSFSCSYFENGFNSMS